MLISWPPDSMDGTGMKPHRLENGIDGDRRAGGSVVALIGGKGGIGKSNIAANTAIALSRRGLRVILLDAAAQFAHLEIMMNEVLPDHLPEPMSETTPLEQTLSCGPCGVRVARDPGCPGQFPNGHARHSADANNVGRLRAACDVVMIDCGSGISDRAVGLALLSDILILATTPEPTALTDAYATAKVLVRRGFRGSVGLVINMVRSKREAHRMVRRFQRAASEFLGLSVQLLGAIPFDRHFISAARQRKPVLISYPRCAASACIDRISRKLPLGGRAEVREAGLWVHAASLFL